MNSIVVIVIILAMFFALFLITNFALCFILRSFDLKRKSFQKLTNTSCDFTFHQSRNTKILLKRRIGAGLNRYGYGFVRYSFIVCSYIPSYRVRNFIFRHIFLMKITKETLIMGGCEVRSPWNLTADRCTIGSNCILDARSGISFDEDVCLGSGVHIWTQEHDLSDPLFRVTDHHSRPVIVEEHCWICSDSTILPGVKIGRGCVIASRACVIKDCEPFAVMGGVPAKKIGERPQNLTYRTGGKPFWSFF